MGWTGKKKKKEMRFLLEKGCLGSGKKEGRGYLNSPLQKNRENALSGLRKELIQKKEEWQRSWGQGEG